MCYTTRLFSYSLRIKDRENVNPLDLTLRSEALCGPAQIIIRSETTYSLHIFELTLKFLEPRTENLPRLVCVAVKVAGIACIVISVFNPCI